MKKTTVIAALSLACAGGPSVQGQVNFNTRAGNPGEPGYVFAPIYGVDPAHPSTQMRGQSITNGGAIDYGLAPLLTGFGFTAALFGGLAPITDENSSNLAFVATTVFRPPGALAGHVIQGPAPPIPGVRPDSVDRATLQVRVWNNLGGTVTSWEAAKANPTLARGSSALFTVPLPVGGDPGTGGVPPLVGLTSFNLVAPEPTAQSTFDSDSDGWGSIVRQYFGTVPFSNHAYLGTNATALHRPAGGNPGGFMEASEPATNVGDWYWRAPAKFLGDKSRAYNSTLAFDLISNLGTAPVTLADHDVILSGGGVTLYGGFLIVTQANKWQHFSIPLRETAGWSVLATGLPATSNQMMTVLSTLNTLDIRGEFGDGADIGGIDNVSLGPLVSGPALLDFQFYPGLTITGTVGSLYRIDYATQPDTNHWRVLTSVVLPSSPYVFTDLSATNQPKRFYRAVGLIAP